MITVVSGENRFLVQQHMRRTVDPFIAEHGDLAVERIDANEASYDDIRAAVESLPFLVSKKLVIVNNLSQNKEAAEKFDELKELASDTTDLFIVEAKLDKRGAYYKKLKKQKEFTEYAELDESSLSAWLVDMAHQLNGSISRSDASYLVQRVGANQLRLSNEVKKLIQYNVHITKSSIDDLTVENPGTTIFNLIDSIFSGNMQQALRIYDEQRKLRIEPQAIHGMLVWQMHTVAIISAAPKNTPAQTIASQSGISPFVVQKSQRIAAKMSRSAILQFLQLLRDIDYRSKRSALDYDEALRFAIVSLAK